MSVTLGYSGKKAATHDVYEVYALSLLLEAAHSSGWTPQLRDGFGTKVTSAVFRAGPGRITSHGYTFAVLTKPGHADLEAHVGVKVSGRTAVRVSKGTASRRLLHEFDLLVLPSAKAAACRTAGTDPDHTDVVVHGEMKYHGGNLGLPLGRASVGLAVECAVTGKSVLMTNQLGFTVQDLVEGHGVRFRFRVLPSNPIAEGHVVRWFATRL